jgi:hypothetical protein
LRTIVLKPWQHWQINPWGATASLQATLDIQDERDRTEALTALADKLTLELLPQALEVVQAIQDENYRVQALAALQINSLRCYRKPRKLPQAIENENYRASALKALVDKLMNSPQACCHKF